MSEFKDDRFVGQVVWLSCGRFHHEQWRPLTIEKIFKRYVQCSDGKRYNLEPFLAQGDERGCQQEKWTTVPYITKKDMRLKYEAGIQAKRRQKLAGVVEAGVSELSIEQLETIAGWISGKAIEIQ